MTTLKLTAIERDVYRTLNALADDNGWPWDETQVRAAARAAVAVIEERHAKGQGRRRVRPPGGMGDFEVEVLQLLAENLTNGDIAARLGVDRTEVEGGVRRLYAALRASSRQGLVVAGRRRGLLPAPGAAS